MTDNEIIKALECCCNSNTNDYYCEDCPYEHKVLCVAFLSKDVLDLINRQKAEIKKYRNRNQAQKAELTRLYKQATEQKAEIERLKKEILDLIVQIAFTPEERYFAIKSAKSEAIKEFCARIERVLFLHPAQRRYYDEIKKEFIKETENGQ